MAANEFVNKAEQTSLGVYTSDATTVYRKYDEEFFHTKAYARLGGKITSLSGSFSKSPSVLDVGCGTGRYFHAIKNPKSITGIDVSANMLQQAVHPFKREEIPLDTINLIEGNFYHHDFKGQKFDFIYSVGVLGEYVPFDAHLCNKLHQTLEDGGVLYFTVVDIEPRKNWKRKMMEAVYPALPAPVKAVLDKRWETCYMTYDQLDAVVKAQGFKSYTIDRYVSEDERWDGVHLECTAHK